MPAHAIKQPGRVRRTVVLATMLAVVSALAVLVPPASPAGAGDPPEFPRTSDPFGTPYKGHVRHWTRWFFETAGAESPIADPSNCDVNQSGPVYFLPASLGAGQSASCHVGADQGLVVPVGGGLSWPDPGEGFHPRVLLAEAREASDDVERLSLTVDGVRVRHIRRRFHVAVLVTADVPADNALGLPAGPRPFANVGWFVVIQPLSPGAHEIVASDTFRSDGSTLDITYDLTVAA